MTNESIMDLNDDIYFKSDLNIDLASNKYFNSGNPTYISIFLTRKYQELKTFSKVRNFFKIFDKLNEDKEMNIIWEYMTYFIDNKGERLNYLNNNCYIE